MNKLRKLFAINNTRPNVEYSLPNMYDDAITKMVACDNWRIPNSEPLPMVISRMKDI